MRKKVLAVLLCLCMALTLLPTVAFAGETAVEISDFESLQTAITNASTDLTLKLADDYTGSVETLTVGGNHQITIDLNGKTLDGGTSSAVSISGSGTLTLKNGKITAEETENNFTTERISAISARDTANLSIKDCTVSALSDVDAITKTSNGSLVIDSSNVTAVSGAAIHCSAAGSISLSGKCVIGTDAEYFSAIHSWQNSLSINGDISIYSKSRSTINDGGPEQCSILGGTVIIQGSPALANRPKTSDYQNLKITASANLDGSNPETYDEAKITQYKYLKFEPDVVAQVGTANFVTLQAALDAAGNGDTVTLLQDRTEAVTIASNNDKNITLDLNEHKLDGGNDVTINHLGSGKLTITGDGVITANGTSDMSADAKTTGVIILSGGSLEINSGEAIVTGKHKAIIINNGAGDVTITGEAALKNNVQANNSSIYNGSTGTVTVSGNASIVSQANVSNEILNMSTGAVNISEDAKISTENSYSCAIKNESSGKISISGNAVVSAKGNSTVGTIDLVGGTVSDVVLDMSGGTVIAEGWQGVAVYNRAAGDVILSGGNIKGPQSNGYGIRSNGKILIPGGSVLLQGGFKATISEPDTTTYYPQVIITASQNYDGSAPETYNANRLGYYTYLKYEPDMASMPSATIGNISVTGATGTAIAPVNVTITLTNTKFKALAANTDVSDWFANLPAGLTAKIGAEVADNDTVATVTFSGTPTSASAAAMAVTISAEHLQSGRALAVTENTDAKWNVTVSATQYTIALSASPAAGGSVAGAGRYDENTSRTVTATASAGYHFVKWTENGTQVSTSASYTFTLTGNRTLVAVFEADTPAPAQYTVTKGQNSVWTKGGSGGLEFTANAAYSKFTTGGSVLVDGSVITNDKYTDESGNTVITLKASYLETLTVGVHTLRVNFADGYAETSFTIKAASTGTTGGNGDNGGTNNEQTSNIVIPQTGDNSHMLLWVLLILLSSGGIVAIGITQKKCKSNSEQ